MAILRALQACDNMASSQLLFFLQLTVEDYVHALETLVNDYRFTFYGICYKRILLCWVIFSCLVLIGILFSGYAGITLFSLGVVWLFVNAGAIFLCMFIKVELARNLERCIARVNKQLLRHKILLALDDRGNLSCHNVNLTFLYLDATQCIDYLNDFIERSGHSNGAAASSSTVVMENGWENRLDLMTDNIIIQGSKKTLVSRKQVIIRSDTVLYYVLTSHYRTVDSRGGNIFAIHSTMGQGLPAAST